ncbi:MAG: SoxR reducing system RseC family protein [Salinivirgaceae bacterium]|nr:SoxR reducing system RseC family protein [Salinivirgaceae bacterium]
MGTTDFSKSGTIISSNGNTVTVQIECSSACSACHSKDMCLSSEKAEKQVVAQTNGRTYTVGQRVLVSGSKAMANSAIALAYIVPFVLVVITLIVCLQCCFSELQSGLVSILILIPYYAVLYMFRHKLNNKFVFIIKE